MGLWNAFRRRWVLGSFLGLLVGTTLAVGIWLVLPSGKHQARAIVQLRSRGVELSRNNEDFAEYRQRQTYLLKSRDLITRTLADPAIASLRMVQEAADPVQMLETQIRVKPVTEDLIEVTLTGDQLDDMGRILDHLVKRFIDDATIYDNRDLDEQIKKREELARQLRLEIESLHRQIEMQGRVNSTLGGEDNAKRLAYLQQRYIETDSEYNRLGRELVKIEAELKVLRLQVAEKNPTTPPDPVLLAEAIEADPLVAKARAFYEQEEQLYKKELKNAARDDIPYIVDLKTKLDKAKADWEEARQAAQTRAIERVRALENVNRQQRIAQLDQLHKIKTEEREKVKEERNEWKKMIDAGVVGGLDIQTLRDALKPQKEMLDQTNAALAKLRMDQKLSNRITLRGDIDKIPNHNQNRKILFSALGGLGGLGAVVALIAFLEWRTRRVDNVDQVVSDLGLRVIGTVPAFPNRASLKAAVETGSANWRFVLNESINSARTMLLHTARTQSMQVVMVTSAMQGEGKTSLASQLASSMATAGMRTLLVDGDLRNPSIQKLFDLPLAPGVSEVLRHEIDVSEVIQATAVPNLWVITAGQCSHVTIAALAQGHPLETLFNRLRGQFDFVIVDSCPVLPVADALLMGQHVDGVVFSIMQDISQLPKVMTASEKLQQLNIPLLGAVVNGIKHDVYSYGYNYVKQLPA